MARCYQINILIVGIIGQALISTANGRVTGGCFIEPFAKIRIADRVRLQVKHAGNHLQTILDAVVDLLEKDLMTIERRLKFALGLLLFDRFAAPCKKATSCSPNSPSDRLSTSSTPNGEPSPWRMTFVARRMPCSTSNSGVLNRCSFSRWFEITGLPVRKA